RDVHLGRVARELAALLDGAVAPATAGGHFTLEERAVAHRAVRNTFPGVFLLSRHTELDRGPARRENHGRRAIGFPPGRGDVEPAVLRLADPFHAVGDDLGPELLGMLGHLLGQLPALDALEPDVVLDQVRVQELAAGRATLNR